VLARELREQAERLRRVVTLLDLDYPPGEAAIAGSLQLDQLAARVPGSSGRSRQGASGSGGYPGPPAGITHQRASLGCLTRFHVALADIPNDVVGLVYFSLSAVSIVMRLRDRALSRFIRFSRLLVDGAGTARDRASQACCNCSSNLAIPKLAVNRARWCCRTA
jgi:hypothetical protein